MRCCTLLWVSVTDHQIRRAAKSSRPGCICKCNFIQLSQRSSSIKVSTAVLRRMTTHVSNAKQTHHCSTPTILVCSFGKPDLNFAKHSSKLVFSLEMHYHCCTVYSSFPPTQPLDFVWKKMFL